MRFPLALLACAALGVIGGAFLIGTWAVGLAIVFDSLCLGAWAVWGYDDGHQLRAVPGDGSTLAQVLERARDAS